jgi:phenylacetate-CoA ligase
MSKLYSNLIKTLALPLADRFMDTSIHNYYNQIGRMRSWSAGEIKDWQEKNLSRLLCHAYNNTKHYKNIFDDNRIHPNDIKSIEDLKHLPVLDKRTVIENHSSLTPSNINDIPYIASATGGSSGDPMQYNLDKKSWSYSVANTIINWESAGYMYGDKYLALGSTSLHVTNNFSFKHFMYYRMKGKVGANGINMSDEICNEYVGLIKKKKINYLYGYASAIYLLAVFVLRHNIEMDIAACFPTSEVLTEEYEKIIRNAFMCNIINTYGANDGGITAFEIDKSYMKLGYNCLIHLDNKDKNNSGSALVTDLFNYSTPFINYQIGDDLKIDEDNNATYPYNGQIINEVNGRTSEVIRLSNGNVLTGPGFTILFKDMPVEGYALQRVDSNMILCKIKKRDDYSAVHEKIIHQALQKQAGVGIKIVIKYIDTFPTLRSGKRSYFIA